MFTFKNPLAAARGFFYDQSTLNEILQMTP